MSRSVPFVVGALSLAYLLAMVDRLILGLLVQPIKTDLHLSDAQIGALAGLAFGLFYTVMGIPLGRLADRVHRPVLVCSGVLVWSLATMACGLAQSFGALFATRVCVGVGEASISPAAYALIADVVPRPRLGRALSVYMLGTVVGLGLAWIAGGQMLQWLAAGALDLPLLRGLAPWQTVFVMVGLPGLLVAPLILLIAEPRRGAVGDEMRRTRSSLAAVREQLRAGARLYGAHFLGMAAVNTYGFALVTWAPALFQRAFAWPAERAGVVLGAGILVTGTIGMLGSGALADSLTRRGLGDAPFRILLLGTLLMGPLGILGPLAPNGALAAGLFVAPVMGLFFAVVACAPTVLQVITPAPIRASISSVYLFVVNLVAFALGPLSVGLLSDALGGAGHDLTRPLMAIALVCLPLGALAFRAGLAPYRRVAAVAGS